MKKKLFLFTALVFCYLTITGSGCDETTTVDPPVTGKEFINFYVDPLSVPFENGSFTANVIADWSGPEPGYCNIVIIDSTVTPPCTAWDTASIAISKNTLFTKTIYTNNFRSFCHESGHSYCVVLVSGDPVRSQRITLTGVLPNLNAYVEKGILNNVVNWGYITMNNGIASAISTFRNPNSDSHVDIVTQTNNNNQGYSYSGQNFTGGQGLYDMETQIYNYIVGPPTIHVDPTNYPYLLAFGYYARFNTQNYPDEIVAGVSMNINNPLPEYTNWDANFSIVFIRNIHDFSNQPPATNETSLLNQTIPHELIHQIGNTWDHGTGHSTEQPHCVLNLGNYFITYTNYFYQLTTQYAICQNHYNFVRGELDDNLNKITNTSYKISSLTEHSVSIKKENSIVNIRLPKNIYKQYEPIYLMAEWINHNNSADSIWSLFSEGSEDPNIFISDEKGNEFNINKDIFYSTILYKNPQYIVMPGDTLLRTIKINNYGSPVSNPKNIYFGNYGYFEPGKYKLYMIFDEDYGRKYEHSIKTNEIEFEIKALDETDKKVLDLAKGRNYIKALNLYPANYFEELLKYYDLNEYLGQYLTADIENKIYKELPILIDKYNDFFNTYPNSLYNLNDVFIYNYISINSKDLNDLLYKANDLMNKYGNSNIGYIIRDINKKGKLVKMFEDRQRIKN